MNVPQLLEEVRRRVPLGAAFGTRWKGTAVVSTPLGALQVAAAARIDVQGQRREQFWCDGCRVELAVLLRLTCSEGECPHTIQVRAQWTDFRHPRRVATGTETSGAQPLMAEVELRVGRQNFTARPARFPCFTPCPHGAHPPMTIEKTGFDLFEDSSCLGGGVTESLGVRRPRIPTVQAAEAYVLARHLETLVFLGQVRGGARHRPGPANESE
jgi:hypothetical protein